MTISMNNRFICAVFLCLLATFCLRAQDTLTIQTFNWNSDTRSDIFEFPADSTETYSKILMTYNMRCHDNQVGSGNVGCREWDYSCNTFVTDSSRMDSILSFHPSHLISMFSEDVFRYRTDPVYAYTRHDRIRTELDTAYSAQSFMTLSDQGDVRILKSNQAAYQYLLTADELIQAGLSEGPLVGMELPFELGDFMSMSFRVRFQLTEREALMVDDPIRNDWQEAFFNELVVNQPGMNTIYFHTPFDWDGTSNLAVEVAFNDKMTPTDERIFGENSTNKALIVDREEHVFALNGAQFFNPDPRDYRELNKEITVMAWLWGNPADLPANTYLLEGVDTKENRQLNIHLPWSNGEVYWDCGNDGDGYDRINKKANPEDFEGQWNHWAFTKDVTTGEMKIYLNGELWHSAGGKTKSIDVDKMVIGKGYDVNNGWSGWINELSIWETALDDDQIKAAMMEPVDSHDLYDDVLMYFNFEEKRGSKVTNVKNNQDYAITGSPFWRRLRAEDLYFDYRAVDARPAISFIQGEVELTHSENPYIDSAMVPPHWVRPFHIENNREVVEDPSMYLWRAGNYYMTNDNGDVVDTITYEADGEINISELRYFNVRPSKFELLSLVTPYGNGLSLGADGVTFTFDVTDFTPILKGKKRLSIEMGGQWQEELDIKFHFIKGTPPRDVVDIDNIWAFQRGNYGAIQDDRVFEERPVRLHQDASQYKIRSSITGHGQNGEFQRREHYVNINGGQQDFVFSVWKECSTIPVYPQGGTWIFDRAGWCPGDPTLLFENDITDLVQPGELVDIDYGVNGPFMDQANYLVSQQLVAYGTNNRAVDAAVEGIVRPSQNVEWARENPSCNTPTVVIKSYGTETLTEVEIEYGVRGGQFDSYTWTGSLGFEEEAIVELPITREDFWSATNDSKGIFEARIVSVNGGSDDEPQNDIMTSAFELPELLPGPVQLEILTNSRGSETSYRILDHSGNILYEGSGFASNSKTIIDLDLAPGCYTLEVDDSGDDGLYYWYWEQTGQSRGRGYVRFNRLFNGRPVGIKSFESEFGRYIHYDFGIGSLTSNNDPRVLEHLTVYPNPSPGELRVDFFSESGEKLALQISDAYGRNIQSRVFNVSKGQKISEWVDLTNVENGMYFLTFTQDSKTTTRTIFINR